MKIAIATGTRADWGLLQPLAQSLRLQGCEPLVMATHQHLIPEMGLTLNEIRNDGFSPAAIFPAEGPHPASIMAQAAAGASDALKKLSPDALVILGDRCEMLGVASAALLSGVPIVHIAGGTISEGAFDDSVRHAISKMATLHFPETTLCASRLIQMGENPEAVHAVGAIGVSNSRSVKLMSLSELTESLGGWNPGADFLVVTLHAATLEASSPLEIQEMMLSELEALPQNIRLLLTYPNCDVDPTPLIESLHQFERRNPERVKVVASLGRVRYLSAVALSRGVVGNSSSALVEVPSAGVPSLNIGIRQKGRECGPSVIHAEATSDGIRRGLRQLLSPEMQALAALRQNPYEGPDPVGEMTRIILSTPFSPYPEKRFHKIN